MSPQRVDYYDSPEAPKATSLVPAVNVVVTNDAGEILLIRRTDNGNWAVPGGAIDLGESVAQAAVRETLEGPAVRAPRLHDGPVNAHPHQRLPRTQRDTGDHLVPHDRREIDPH
jgi:ADP-ribose pyrophosphatase YjhB (NUDIX family)